MRIFLTGATGVVGRRLVPLLRRAGHEVTAIARSRESREKLERQGVRATELDLFDRGAVLQAVAGHETVINLATRIPSPSRIFLPWAWRETDRLRREASAILSSACVTANVSRFIQESFAPVYPDHGAQWIDETIPIVPVSYNRTITDAENSADRFSRSGRIGIVLRFGAFYGPDAAQTAEFIKYVKKGRAPLPGPESAYISSVSHDDAATAVAAAIALPAGIYNVVDDEPVTHRELFDSLADVLHVNPPKPLPGWVTPLMGSLGALMSRSLRISNHKLRSASSWAPQYPSVREGWAAVAAQAGVLSHGVPSDLEGHQKA